MEHKCPKCGRYGIQWDGRAKIIQCLYHGCQHIVKLSGFEHGGIPSKGEVRAAIENEMVVGNAKELEYVDAELVCPKCSKRVTVTLFFSKKGIAKANKYYCGCACVLMDVEFSNGNSGSEDVDKNSG